MYKLKRNKNCFECLVKYWCIFYYHKCKVKYTTFIYDNWKLNFTIYDNWKFVSIGAFSIELRVMKVILTKVIIEKNKLILHSKVEMHQLIWYNIFLQKIHLLWDGGSIAKLRYIDKTKLS